MKTWGRRKKSRKGRDRKARPIAEKESIQMDRRASSTLLTLRTRCAEPGLSVVGDRESDVYELFATGRPDGVDWLIRAAHNRRVRHPTQYLWESVQAMAPLGHTDLLVPPGQHAAAYARLTLRGAAVRLRPPKARASRLGELDAFAIHAIEEAPPHGTEPLEWMLLSSVPTTSLDDVLERLAWYARRWGR